MKKIKYTKDEKRARLEVMNSEEKQTNKTINLIVFMFHITIKSGENQLYDQLITTIHNLSLL